MIHSPRYLKVLTCIFVFIALNFSANSSFTYRRVTGAEKDTVSWTVEKDGTVILLTYSAPPFTKSIVTCDSFYQTQSWRFLEGDQKTDLFFQRKDNNIAARGHFKGKPFQNNYKIDSLPWLQNLNIGLRPFLHSRKSRQTFWALRPVDMKLYKIQAIKKRSETVAIGNKNTRSIKVKVTLTGFRANFWKALYWFRAVDYVMLKYRAVHGLPGTPATVLELADEP